VWCRNMVISSEFVLKVAAAGRGKNAFLYFASITRDICCTAVYADLSDAMGRRCLLVYILTARHVFFFFFFLFILHTCTYTVYMRKCVVDTICWMHVPSCQTNCIYWIHMAAGCWHLFKGELTSKSYIYSKSDLKKVNGIMLTSIMQNYIYWYIYSMIMTSWLDIFQTLIADHCTMTKNRVFDIFQIL
jgi:hypothetical protein